MFTREGKRLEYVINYTKNIAYSFKQTVIMFKDGKRDMRYSYKNNPSYIYVYRGSVIIHCNDISYEKKFSNKSLAKTFEKDLENYIKLLRGIYKDIEQAVSNGSLLLKFGNIKEELIEQLYTEIKL